jgi:uncharacterized repeat protein (TIGR01451 family)
MKNLIYIFGVILTFLSAQLSAQCPITDIEIKSQTELIQLFNTYPNCHKITKSITFANTTNAPLADLSLMLRIDTILGDLVLKINNAPTIEGLSNIKYVGGNVTIQSNNALVVIPNFDALKQVNKTISITLNPNLQTVKGFDHLSATGSIAITQNELLDTINAFHRLKTIQSVLNLYLLKNLEVVKAFDSLATCGQDVSIVLNASPKIKVLPSFDQLRYVKSNFTLNANLHDSYECLANLDSIGKSLVLNLPLVTTIKTAPKATSIGRIDFTGSNNLKNLQGFDQLKQVGDLNLSLPSLIQLCPFNELQSATVRIYINLDSLQILQGFNKLNTAGEIFINCISMSQLDFAKQLKNVNGGFEIWAPKVQLHNHFNFLTHVQGKLSFYNLPLLKKLPEYNELQYAGELHITSCSGLTSIDGFNKLQRIAGNFFIANNAALDSVNGFENLKYCGSTMKIDDNPKLIYITGFNSLDTLEGLMLTYNKKLPSINGFHQLSFVSSIFISGCTALKTVTGFEKLLQSGRIEINGSLFLKTIEGFEQLKIIAGYFRVGSEIEILPEFNSLERIEGYFYCNSTKLLKVPAFPKLTSILGDFTFFGNSKIPELGPFPSLSVIKGKIDIFSLSITHLAGLKNVDPTMVTNLKITGNPKLSLCNNRFICAYLALGKPSQISNNAPGCSQPSEIVCTGGLIHGLAFYDRNENGIRDNGEPGIVNMKVDVNNFDPLLISNETGLMSLYCEVGNTYSISSLFNPKFKPTTDTAFVYQHDSNDKNDTLFYFGFVHPQSARDGKVIVTSDRTRCITQARLYVSVLNESYYDQDGEIRLYYNDINALSNFNPTPDFIDHLRGMAVWKFYNLQPPSFHKITASLKVPSEDNTGDTLALHASYYVKNNDGSYQLLDSSRYTSEVLCAYDPNDISVSPLGTLYRTNPEQTFDLTYTIRFQNIGNDTAIDVSLSNLISKDLDRNSLQFLSASHPCNLQLYGDVFEVNFPSIYLPSKSQNEALSQGFLTYSIQTKAGLPDNTVIGNYAEIYFDQNAPILTNTVTSTIKDLIVATNEKESLLFVWFPNPVNDQLCLQIEELPKEINLEVYNQLGQLIYESQGMCHKLGHLSAGPMLAKLSTPKLHHTFMFIKQ